MAKLEKIKAFMKEHKKKFIVTSLIIGGVVVKVVLLKRMSKPDVNVDIPNLTVGDFGKVGEEIMKADPSINPDTIVKAWRVITPKK